MYDQKHEGLMKYQQGLLSSSGDDAVQKELPTLVGGVHCGFLPDITSMRQSSASLLLEHREELKLRQKTRASVIGSINAQGHFWVRAWPDDKQLQGNHAAQLVQHHEVSMWHMHPLPFSRGSKGNSFCILFLLKGSLIYLSL